MSTPPKKNSKSVFMMFAGFVMVLFSSPCVVGMIHDLIMGTDNLSGALMAGLFMSFITLAGLFVFRQGWKNRHVVAHTSLSSEREKAALNAIRDAGGEVTVALLAMSSDLSITEATAFLECLERDGMATSWVTTEGAISYRIPHLSGAHSSISASEDQFVFAEEEVEVEANS